MIFRQNQNMVPALLFHKCFPESKEVTSQLPAFAIMQPIPAWYASALLF